MPIVCTLQVNFSCAMRVECGGAEKNSVFSSADTPLRSLRLYQSPQIRLCRIRALTHGECCSQAVHLEKIRMLVHGHQNSRLCYQKCRSRHLPTFPLHTLLRSSLPYSTHLSHLLASRWHILNPVKTPWLWPLSFPPRLMVYQLRYLSLQARYSRFRVYRARKQLTARQYQFKPFSIRIWFPY